LGLLLTQLHRDDHEDVLATIDQSFLRQFYEDHTELRPVEVRTSHRSTCKISDDSTAPMEYERQNGQHHQEDWLPDPLVSMAMAEATSASGTTDLLEIVGMIYSKQGTITNATKLEEMESYIDHPT
jgi:hypothetical protein